MNCYLDLCLREPIDTALGLLKQACLPELRLGVLHTAFESARRRRALRSGFLAGDAQTVEAYARPQPQLRRSRPRAPVCEISAHSGETKHISTACASILATHGISLMPPLAICRNICDRKPDFFSLAPRS